MASPLHWFRKNQKLLLGFFGVMLMIAFTVSLGTGVDPLVDYISGGGSRRSVQNAVAASWKGGELRESDIQILRYNRARLSAFMQQAYATAVQRGGTPTVPFIPLDVSDQSLVESYLLARQAREMNLQVSDEAVRQYLLGFTGNKVPTAELVTILRASTNRQMTQDQLFEVLRDELLAQEVRIMAQTGVYPRSPVTAWDFYNRLNRRVKAELMPIPVSEFVDKISDPTEQELQAFHAKYRDQYPDPSSSEPGFKRRRQIQFQYARADFNDFLEPELANVTDQEIQEYYDKHKEDYRRSQAPEAGDLEVSPTSPPTEGQGASVPPEPAGEAQTPSQPAPAAEPSRTEQTPTAPETPTTPVPTEPPSAVDLIQPGAEKPEAPEPTAPEPNAPGPTAPDGAGSSGEDQNPDAPAPDNATTPSAPDGAGSSGEDQNPESPAQGQDDPESGDPPPSEPEPPQEPSSSGILRPLWLTQQTVQDAQPTAEDSPPAEQGTQPADQAPIDAQAAEPESPDDQGEKKPNGSAPAPAAGVPPVDAPPGTPVAGAESPLPTYRPLEEVRDEIRRQIAIPRAQGKRDQVLSAMRAEIDGYYRQRLRWQLTLANQPDAVPPVAPDMASLTAKHAGLTTGSTGLVDRLSVQDHELGKTYELGVSGELIPFANLAFDEEVDAFKARLFPQRAMRDVVFLFWKVAGKEESVPELASIRDEVIRAWKMQDDKAVKAAMELAKQVAEQARQSGKSLVDIAADMPGREVRVTEEASWMTTGNLPIDANGSAYLSPIPEAEFPGREFRETMFRLPAGGVEACLNQPHTLVYVVRVVSAAPDQQVLQKRFLESGVSSAVQSIARTESDRALGQWYMGLLKEMDFRWIRDPEDASQLE